MVIETADGGLTCAAGFQAHIRQGGHDQNVGGVGIVSTYGIVQRVCTPPVGICDGVYRLGWGTLCMVSPFRGRLWAPWARIGHG